MKPARDREPLGTVGVEGASVKVFRRHQFTVVTIPTAVFAAGDRSGAGGPQRDSSSVRDAAFVAPSRTAASVSGPTSRSGRRQSGFSLLLPAQVGTTAILGRFGTGSLQNVWWDSA